MKINRYFFAIFCVVAPHGFLQATEGQVVAENVDYALFETIEVELIALQPDGTRMYGWTTVADLLRDKLISLEAVKMFVKLHKPGYRLTFEFKTN